MSRLEKTGAGIRHYEQESTNPAEIIAVALYKKLGRDTFYKYVDLDSFIEWTDICNEPAIPIAYYVVRSHSVLTENDECSQNVLTENGEGG